MMIKDWQSYVDTENKLRDEYNANEVLVSANRILVERLFAENRSARTIGGICSVKSRLLVATLEKAMREMREIEHLESLNADGTHHRVCNNPESEVHALVMTLLRTLAMARSYAEMREAE